MRDYNAIPFRSPKNASTKKVTEHPLVEEEKKVDSNSSGTESTYLTAADALAIRRDGAEITISKLRQALDSASEQESASKAAVAKSEAVILELRSSVRQLKRQLEKVGEEKRAAEEEHSLAKKALEELRSCDNRSLEDAKDARVGELQVQLDRAHAQILTADMVRKELEDTLEAEQYTWELRVQDQERTIQQLQQECATYADDLEQCRKQWKESEDGLNKEFADLQAKLEKAQQEARHWKSLQSDGAEDLKGRLIELEQERGELQQCLDEALKELEAVDHELQGDNLREENARLQKLVDDGEKAILEQLQHLYRWLLERDGTEDDNEHTSPRDARGVIAAIRSHLERIPASDKDLLETRKQVQELESQLSVYRGDLQAREESSAELRASLKEAVSLLKPLQDAIAKADKEKSNLKQELDELKRRSGAGDETTMVEMKKLKEKLVVKEDEIDMLKRKVEDLEIELSRTKLTAASTLISAHKITEHSPDSISKAREELRKKRVAEAKMQEMLKDAQGRFNSLHVQTREVQAKNSDLEDRLRDAEERLLASPSSDADPVEHVSHQLKVRDAKIHELENQLKVLKGDLAERDVELRETSMELEDLKAVAARKDDKAHMLQIQAKVRELEAKLAVNSEELKKKKDAEKSLKKSLKEALGLLKPLQAHLEEAEQEKHDLKAELRELRRRSGDDFSAMSRSMGGGKTEEAIRELEETVKHLEIENAQLHDALEDMSQSINASHLTGMSSSKNDSRLREEIVQLQSRNEVTSGRLDDAAVENHTLIEALKKREKEERAFMEEIKALREQLKKRDLELENAKYIATSALVKVEELTMSNVEQLSLHSGSHNSGFNHDAVFREKARVVDRQMEIARAKIQYQV